MHFCLLLQQLLLIILLPVRKKHFKLLSVYICVLSICLPVPILCACLLWWVFLFFFFFFDWDMRWFIYEIQDEIGVYIYIYHYLNYMIRRGVSESYDPTLSQQVSGDRITINMQGVVKGHNDWRTEYTWVSPMPLAGCYSMQEIFFLRASELTLCNENENSKT